MDFCEKILSIAPPHPLVGTERVWGGGEAGGGTERAEEGFVKDKLLEMVMFF